MLTAWLQFGFGRLVSLKCGFKKLFFDSLSFKMQRILIPEMFV